MTDKRKSSLFVLGTCGCGFILRDLSLRLNQERFQNRQRDSYLNRPPTLARWTEIHLDH